MTTNAFVTRRIFRSSITSQNVIRELLQLIFVAEIIAPSDTIWFVSPWISDVVLFENRTGGFDCINPEWRGRDVRVSDVALHLLTSGSRVVLVTRSDEHNRAFVERLVDMAGESGVDRNLVTVLRDSLHTKGILLGGGVLLGSMNLTYNGLEINDEFVEFDTAGESVGSARLAFEAYLDGIHG